MKNARTIILIGFVVVVLVGAGIGYSFLRPPATASGPIQAVPLEQGAASASTSEPAASAATSAPTAATAAPAATTASEPEATTASEPEATAASEPAATTAASSGVIRAQIVPEESVARFTIDEVLNNAPFTVVGSTNQVAGQLEVDPNDPSKTRVGVIQVNARTLATDSQFRDRAIKNRILNTDQYEFITFTPTELQGLPTGTINNGESYTFKMVGDLTIRDVTRTVTFDVTATPESDTRLKGLAQTTIRYDDFGLTIPQVPQVASVDDNVRLEIEFVAVPV